MGMPGGVMDPANRLMPAAPVNDVQAQQALQDMQELLLKGEAATLATHLAYGLLEERNPVHFSAPLICAAYQDHHWRLMADWQSNKFNATLATLDGRGPLGTARFLAPLLLDAKLSKAFPRLFSPPLLRAIQNEDNSFHALRVAKRRERCAQAAALACALAVGRALCRAAFA